MGRDIFSRMIYGTRVMTIGLVGVTISLVLGVLLGGISGYFGGTVDVIYRMINSFAPCPRFPCGWLWQRLFPNCTADCGILPDHYYFVFINWTGLAK